MNEKIYDQLHKWQHHLRCFFNIRNSDKSPNVINHSIPILQFVCVYEKLNRQDSSTQCHKMTAGSIMQQTFFTFS